MITKIGKDYFLFLIPCEINSSKEVVVYKDKLVQLYLFKSKDIFYYRLSFLNNPKKYLTKYSLLLKYENKCNKEGIVFSDTVHLINLSKNKYNKKLVYAFGESESEVEP